jgi:hypothetical protein
MHSLHSDRATQRRFAWLLWLALLLPLAQTAAAVHLMSHGSRQTASQAEDQKFVHEGACAVCLSAAAVVGGAPLVAVAPAFHAMAPTRVAVPHESPVRLASLIRAYQSRAPPIASC